MEALLVKSLTIYALAAVVSLLVALLIKGIVVALQAIEGPGGSAASPRTRMPELAELPPAIPPEHIAAIGAAVQAMIGPYRVVHIEEQRRRSSWVEGGRHAHHTSHAPASHHHHRT